MASKTASLIRWELLLLLLIVMPMPAVAEGSAGSLYVSDGESIYYYATSGFTGTTWKMNKDGSNGAELTKASGVQMSVADGWLYMLDEVIGSDDTKLRRVRTDGTNLEDLPIVGDSYVWMAANDKAVFLLHHGDGKNDKPGEIARFTTDPWEQRKSLPLPAEGQVNDFKLSGGYIYLVPNDGDAKTAPTFYRAKEDASRFEPLFTAPASGDVYAWRIEADKLTYCITNPDTLQTEIRCCTLEGKEDQLVQITKMNPRFLIDHWAYGPLYVKGDSIEEGFYRLDLTSGELKQLSKKPQMDVHSIGTAIIKDNNDGWGVRKPEIYSADSSKKARVAWPKQ